MIYEGLLLVGGVGLLAQTVLGFAHVGGPGHGAAHGHAAPGHTAHGHAASHGGHHAQHDGTQHGHGGARENPLAFFWTLLSPLALFSLCVGVGASGLILRVVFPALAALVVAVLAVVGGWLFYRFAVRPIWNTVFAFASKPAETLAGAVGREATATGRFDNRGQGVVTVSVDNQIVRLLARLDNEEQAHAELIVSGDRLLVTSIDARSNSCRVTRL